MMEIQDIVIAMIDVPTRLRAASQSKIESIAKSIQEVGLLSPIILYSPDDETLDLVAGAHRLAAVKSLVWETIPAQLIEDKSSLYAQLVEIDENLMRSELTATEYAEHMQRRKEVWEALQSEKNSGGTTWPARNIGYASPPENETGFAESTQNATGQSKRNTNRATKRAREVCQQARDIIRGTGADTGTFLDQVARIDDEGDQIKAAQEKVDAIERRERSLELREEERARKADAKERQREAKTECINFLHEKLHARDWQYLIRKLDESCGSIRSADLRDWEADQSC